MLFSVTLQIDHMVLKWHKLLLDEVGHLALDGSALVNACLHSVLRNCLVHAFISNPESSVLLNYLRCVGPHRSLMRAEVE